MENSGLTVRDIQDGYEAIEESLGELIKIKSINGFDSFKIYKGGDSWDICYQTTRLIEGSNVSRFISLNEYINSNTIRTMFNRIYDSIGGLNQPYKVIIDDTSSLEFVPIGRDQGIYGKFTLSCYCDNRLIGESEFAMYDLDRVTKTIALLTETEWFIMGNQKEFDLRGRGKKA